MLARIYDKHDNLISAEKFFKNLTPDQLFEFDSRALRCAIHYLKEYPDCHISVNASAQTVNNPQWRDEASKILDPKIVTSDIASRLTVEITEDAPLNVGQARLFTALLEERKIKFSIDDFGTSGTELFLNVATIKALGHPHEIKFSPQIFRGRANPQRESEIRSTITEACEELCLGGHATFEGSKNQKQISHINNMMSKKGTPVQHQTHCFGEAEKEPKRSNLIIFPKRPQPAAMISGAYTAAAKA